MNGIFDHQEMMSRLEGLMPVSCLQDSSVASNPANHWQVSKPPFSASRHWDQARQGCGLQMLSRSTEERKQLICPFCRKFVPSFWRESHPEPCTQAVAAPPAGPSPSPLQCHSISSGSGPLVTSEQNYFVTSCIHFFSSYIHFLPCLSTSFILQVFPFQLVKPWQAKVLESLFQQGVDCLLQIPRGVVCLGPSHQVFVERFS